MDEMGVDLRRHESKAVDRFAGQTFDWVITVCDDAREACPNFPGGRRTLHWSFEDPASAAGPEAGRLAVFRRVRDSIADRLAAWLEESAAGSG
jgi:arsenate reductase